jgi:hypothetical protein
MSDIIGYMTMYVRYVCTHVCWYVRMYVCEAIAAVQDRMDSSQFSKLMRVGAYVCPIQLDV